jgi:ribosomal-protein-alanine N-acetyltransferase
VTVRLQRLTLPAFEALAGGDVAAAEHIVGLALPAEFAAQTDIWAYMITLLAGHPENDDWVMQAVVHDGAAIGNAGFKGAPDAGQVELGYRISSTHRRHGHAASAVRLLLDRAEREPDVETVIATIDPTNEASIAVATASGFTPDGDRMHPRWGRQLVFRHDVRSPRTSGRVTP